MNNILDSNGKDCTSCQICSAVCPVRAIHFSLDLYGFYRPIIDNSLCVSCGKCKRSCVKFNSIKKVPIKLPELYAAVNKNKRILTDSSSGGVATVLYEYGIKLGYKCFGVTYNYTEHTANGYIFNTKSDIHNVRKSKYIPVNAETVLREIIESSEKWIIIAAPCMLYGIKKALDAKGKKLDNYILIDFFCHGTPSQLLWDKQIDEILQKYKEISQLNFRSKNKGWHSFLLSFFSGEKQICMNNTPFYELFFSDYMLNSSCTDCKLRDFTDIPDIRIGDFWGAKYDISLQGVSAVLCFSTKGRILLNSCSPDLDLKKENISNLLPFQAVEKKYFVNSRLRFAMFSALNEKSGLKKAVKIYRKSLPIKKRIVYMIKLIVRRIFPSYIQAKLRRIFHR